jgi:hypothetical protein
MNIIPLVDGSKLKIQLNSRNAKVSEESRLIANLFPLCVRNCPESWQSFLPKTLDRGLLENLKKLVGKFRVISEAEKEKCISNPVSKYYKGCQWKDFQGITANILNQIDPIDKIYSNNNPICGVFFSNGLDSWHALDTHFDEITTLITYVVKTIYGVYYDPMIKIAKMLQKDVISVSLDYSNMRELWRTYLPEAWLKWEHIPLKVAIAYAIPSLHKVYIGGGYPTMPPDAPMDSSMIETDPLYSTPNRLEFVNVADTRTNKLVQVLESKNVSHLFKLYSKPCLKDWTKNCCLNCHKCIHFLLVAEILGVRHECETLGKLKTAKLDDIKLDALLKARSTADIEALAIEKDRLDVLNYILEQKHFKKKN